MVVETVFAFLQHLLYANHINSHFSKSLFNTTINFVSTPTCIRDPAFIWDPTPIKSFRSC